MSGDPDAGGLVQEGQEPGIVRIVRPVPIQELKVGDVATLAKSDPAIIFPGHAALVRRCGLAPFEGYAVLIFSEQIRIGRHQKYAGLFAASEANELQAN